MTAHNCMNLHDSYSLHPSTSQLPPLSDPRKAQKMMGLAAERPSSRRNTLNFHAPKSGMIKAQRTLGMAVDGPKDRRSEVGSNAYQGDLEKKLRQAEMDVRRLSGMAALSDRDDESIKTGRVGGHSRIPSTSTRGWIEIGVEEEEPEITDELEPSRPSPFPPQIELPAIRSPSPLSMEPVELDATTTTHICRPASRSRQSSCASSRFHERPTNKIASSRWRAMRSNTCPDFPGHLPTMGLKPVPGEDMERDPLHVRYSREPPTPSSPLKSPLVFDHVEEARAHAEEELKSTAEEGAIKPETDLESQQKKPKRTRWSSLPMSLIKFTKRHSKPEERILVEERISVPNHEHEEEKSSEPKSKVELTLENLQRWEDEVGCVPKIYRMSHNMLNSPEEIDMEVKRGMLNPRRTTLPNPPTRILTPTPTPNLQNLTNTPPASPPLAQSSFCLQDPRQHHRPSYLHARASTTPCPPHMPTLPQRAYPPSPLLTPDLSRTYPSPLRSPALSLQTLASEKETAAESASTLLMCVMCKDVEHPSTFPTRRITDGCAHPTRACLDCLRVWIVETAKHDWDGARCPECGLSMREEDIQAFMWGYVG
ncbi:hypothetical protein P280DRAFT_553250 [Massarina eburnea CBS 473.64]|uniref:RING-type domain-containing protein n=1 Tax=Massarina eburnea CBS 473.64 TaxID=1395130 RepID=A0A6A6RLL0_9PLEO|nr:hypothetical protein P280DRAFT_553250 [Massarina eburnea CBS 473.64]